MRELPSGTVTFVFTDVEGSTRLLHELGAEAYAEALAEHRRVIREACRAHGGVEVDTQGDAFFFAFPTAPGALAAGSAMTEALASGEVRVRVGLHTGTPLVAEEGYVGDDVHFAARVAAAGHGGQVILSSATAELVERSLTDLGEHRLKDIPGPVAIFQLGEGSFPPLKTIANTNLPTPVSSFLGRAAELYDADLLLQGSRLLTITGPGGAGKTRFALELARRAREERFSDYPAGVFSCFLASLRDPSLVLPTLAQVLSVSEQSGQSAPEALTSHLEGKRMLLLVDNLEHLLEAVPELAWLLERCSGLTLLVTSRELLRARGEATFALPPLAEAVALFCERARIEPSEPVRELCERLEGLPLAIELAAARLAILTPEQLLERLSRRLDLLRAGRDADPRQQTLRATIEWSHDLLTSEEQQLFARLSVFAGGCTLEAAEEVCEADLDGLQSLVDKSLLRFSEGRYWMLETIREYAAEKLHDAGEAQIRQLTHAEWFTRFAHRELGEIGDGRRELGIAEGIPERDNVRVALAWSWANDRDDLGLRLGASGARYWCNYGQFEDADAWLAEAERRMDTAPPELRLGALKAAVMIEGAIHGDAEACERHFEEAILLAEHVGTQRDVLWLRHGHAITLSERGELDEAIDVFDSVLAGYRALGDRRGEAMELHHLGEAHRDAGNHDRAAELLGDAIALQRELGEAVPLSHALHGLADLALDRGDLDGAVRYYREGLSVAVEPRGQVACLAGLATALARNGRTSEAAKLCGAVAGAQARLGASMFPTEDRRYTNDLDGLTEDLEWEAGRALSLDEAVSYALASLD